MHLVWQTNFNDGVPVFVVVLEKRSKSSRKRKKQQKKQAHMGGYRAHQKQRFADSFKVIISKVHVGVM